MTDSALADPDLRNAMLIVTVLFTASLVLTRRLLWPRDEPHACPCAPTSAWANLAGLTSPWAPEYVLDLTRRLGDSHAFRVRLPFLSWQLYVLTDVEAARALLDDPAAAKPAWYYAPLNGCTGWASTVFTAPTLAACERDRRLAAPAFNATGLARARRACAKHAAALAASTVERACGTDGGVDVSQLSLRLCAGVVCEACFGYELSFAETEVLIEAVTCLAREYAQRRLANPLRAYASALLPEARRAAAASGRVRALCARMLQQHRAQGTAAPRDSLLAALDGPAAAATPDRAKLSELSGWLLAAVDTSAHALGWLLCELAAAGADGPQRDARAEARASAGGQRGAPAAPLLDACVRETLRLHPPTAFLVRTTASALPLRARRGPGARAPAGGGGAADPSTAPAAAVPAGAHVLVPIFALQRSAAAFEEPDSFVPERWRAQGGVSSAPHSRLAQSCLPFGAGRRACPGEAWARASVAALAAELLARYELSALQPPLPYTVRTRMPFCARLRVEHARSADASAPRSE